MIAYLVAFFLVIFTGKIRGCYIIPKEGKDRGCLVVLAIGHYFMHMDVIATCPNTLEQDFSFTRDF